MVLSQYHLYYRNGHESFSSSGSSRPKRFQFSIFLNKGLATKGFFFSERVTINCSYFFICKDEERNSIFPLFTTATKNQIITIFIPFSTSSSKCRITPRGCGFFSTNWSPPFTTPMGMVYRVHNYSSYYRTLT